MKNNLIITQEWAAIAQLLEAQKDALAIFVEKLQEIDRKPTSAVQMACSKYVKYVYIHLGFHFAHQWQSDSRGSRGGDEAG